MISAAFRSRARPPRAFDFIPDWMVPAQQARRGARTWQVGNRRLDVECHFASGVTEIIVRREIDATRGRSERTIAPLRFKRFQLLLTSGWRCSPSFFQSDTSASRLLQLREAAGLHFRIEENETVKVLERGEILQPRVGDLGLAKVEQSQIASSPPGFSWPRR